MSEAIQVTSQSSSCGYPRGARSILRDQAQAFRSAEGSFVAQLHGRGYEEVIVPIIDYAAPYLPVHGDGWRSESYRFVDPAGDLVVLRSDFTPMVARALAPHVTSSDLPLRIFYRGDVVRRDARQIGAGRMFHQIGAEVVGDPSPSADIEVVALAAELARCAGADPRLILQDQMIAPALLQACGLDEEAARVLRSALSSRDRAMFESMATLLEPERAEALRRIMHGTATAAEFVKFPQTAESAERLLTIERGIRVLKLDSVLVSLELEDERASYYTGFRFRLHDSASRYPIAKGGRYDLLYGCFGREMPAVGMTFTLDALAGWGRSA